MPLLEPRAIRARTTDTCFDTHAHFIPGSFVKAVRAGEALDGFETVAFDQGADFVDPALREHFINAGGELVTSSMPWWAMRSACIAYFVS